MKDFMLIGRESRKRSEQHGHTKLWWPISIMPVYVDVVKEMVLVFSSFHVRIINNTFKQLLDV